LISCCTGRKCSPYGIKVWVKSFKPLFSPVELKKLGIPLYSPDKAIKALRTEGIDMLQFPTNILDRRFENAGVFKLVDEKQKLYIFEAFFFRD